MDHSKQPWSEFARGVAAFSLLAVSITLLWRSNPVLLVIVLAESLLALRLWHDRYDVSIFLVIAVLGSLAEAAFVHYGVWRYSNPSLLGVPVWFPLAFGTSGLIGGRLARCIASMWEQAAPLRASEE